MKKFVWLPLVILFVACQKEVVTSNVSGTIVNADFETISIKGITFEKTFTIDAEGVFGDTLTIPYAGLYTLQAGSTNSKPLYLEPGVNLTITFDASAMENTIAFSGEGSAENNYIKIKYEMKENIYGKTNLDEMRALYTLPEAEFLALHDRYTQKMNAVWDDTLLQNALFMEAERQDLKHHINNMIWMYPRYYKHFTENSDFETSEDFPVVTLDFKTLSEADYYHSLPYRNLVGNMFGHQVYEDSDTDTKPIDRGIAILKSLNSQLLKNELIRSLMYEFNASLPNMEAVYQQLLSLTTNESFKKELTEKFEGQKNLVVGKPSPSFDYLNYEGGTTSLASLAGKYVYIDVWATWCGPCIREIPALLTLEKDYHEANIHFVSISIDAEKDYDKWRTMVAEKSLGGIQLFADKDWSSDFVKAYGIDGIPRFILVGPDGNIVTADAPRPSSPDIRALFDTLD